MTTCNALDPNHHDIRCGLPSNHVHAHCAHVEDKYITWYDSEQRALLRFGAFSLLFAALFVCVMCAAAGAIVNSLGGLY